MKQNAKADVAPASVGNNSEPCQSADAASESARAISRQASLHLAHPWQAHSAHEFAVSRHEVESGAAPTKEERERHLRLASEHRAAAEYWAKKESESRDIKAAPAECGQHTPTRWDWSDLQAILNNAGEHLRDSSPASSERCFEAAKRLTQLKTAHDRLVSALKELIYRNELMVGYALRGETETRWTDKQSISRPGELANHDALLTALQSARTALAQAQKSA